MSGVPKLEGPGSPVPALRLCMGAKVGGAGLPGPCPTASGKVGGLRPALPVSETIGLSRVPHHSPSVCFPLVWWPAGVSWHAYSVRGRRRWRSGSAIPTMRWECGCSHSTFSARAHTCRRTLSPFSAAAACPSWVAGRDCSTRRAPHRRARARATRVPSACSVINLRLTIWIAGG